MNTYINIMIIVVGERWVLNLWLLWDVNIIKDALRGLVTASPLVLAPSLLV
jgi:hypothetical protein